MTLRARASTLLVIAVAAAGVQGLVPTGARADTVGTGRAIGAAAAATPVDVQLLATNDFHGRIAKDPTSAAAGAGVLAGAVKQLRAQNPDNTVFAAAGDLIGASTFESFIDDDKPTIDALNSAGLEVSAVGNHEFDQGYDDLVNRVMKPYDARTNPRGGAGWKYIGANVRFKNSGNPAIDGTYVKTLPSGIEVGFVGAVTEHLPELVSPGGIADIKVTDIVEATNTAADKLKADGADVIVLLVHEGAAGTDCATMDDDPTSDFGSIIAGVDKNVDAIVSGHTHLEYNCSFPVPAWAADPSRIVKDRPVVSAGQYGSNLNKVVFSVDPTTGQVLTKTQDLLQLKTATSAGTPPTTTYTENYPTDAATQTIVDAAVANAEVLGARPLGQITGTFSRAKLDNGTTENRGGESTLGNLVAEIQRWATRNPESGSAQIAFMNPGGLRADLSGTGTDAFPRTVTYKQAATVQPFANTLVNMDLTGAQLKTVLEQQWQPAGSSRPFLKLGISKGFTYTYDPSRAQGARITAMFLDGLPINPATSYSVTVNSFLAAGGDNFSELANGTGRQDTGKTDLQGQVDYFAEYAATTPLPVDASQRGVGVTFPAGAPASYSPGATVALVLSSLSMTGPGDAADTQVEVSLGGQSLGTFPVVTTRQSALPGFDEAGTAAVNVVLPAGTPAGAATLRITGGTTGTSVSVPLVVSGSTTIPGAVRTDASAKVRPSKVVVRKTRAKVTIKVTSATGAAVDGQVTLKLRGEKARTVTVTGGRVRVNLGRFAEVGRVRGTVTFLGNASFTRSTDKFNVYVKRR